MGEVIEVDVDPPELTLCFQLVPLFVEYQIEVGVFEIAPKVI